MDFSHDTGAAIATHSNEPHDGIKEGDSYPTNLLKPKIDKISVCLAITNPEDRKSIINSLLSLIDCPDEGFKKASKKNGL